MEPHRKVNRIITATFLLAFLFLGGCAHIEAPPGGPEDKTPPYLMAVFPEPGAVNVPLELNVQLEFSEWMSSRFADLNYVHQITLSPILPRKLKFEVKGKKVRVYSNSKLEPNTTYILSVNNGLTDMQNQALANPFQLVFSTGGQVDTNSYSGMLFGDGDSKVKKWLGLYPLGEIRNSLQYLPGHGSDSLKTFPDITKERPMYLSASDSMGSFSLTGVKEGAYVAVGFADANGDLKPQPGQEPIAIGDSLNFKEPLTGQWKLEMSKWEPLKLLSASWKKAAAAGDSTSLKGILELKFNSKIFWEKVLQSQSFKVEAVDSGSVPSLEMPFLEKGEISDVIRLGLQNVRPSQNYVLSCSSLVDVYGNGLDSVLYKAKFESSPVEDSLKFILDFPQAKKGDSLIIKNQQVLALHNGYFQRGELAKDSSEYFWILGKDSISVKPIWRDFSSFNFPFTQSVDTTGNLKLISKVSSTVTDSSGKDSLISQAFTLLDFTLRSKEDWGSLLIELPPAPNFNQGKLVSLFKKEDYSLNFRQKNSLKLDSLLPGNYQLEVFMDENDNGVWDPGSYNPWKVQEYYKLLPDTVRIEAREPALMSLQKMK